MYYFFVWYKAKARLLGEAFVFSCLDIVYKGIAHPNKVFRTSWKKY